MKLLRKTWKPLLSAIGWTFVIMIHPWLAYSHTDQRTILGFAIGGVLLSLVYLFVGLFDREEERDGQI